MRHHFAALIQRRDIRYFPGLHLLWSGPLVLVLASLLLWQGVCMCVIVVDYDYYLEWNCSPCLFVFLVLHDICIQSLDFLSLREWLHRLQFRCLDLLFYGGLVS